MCTYTFMHTKHDPKYCLAPCGPHKDTLLQAKADQVIWLLPGCGGDVIVIGGRAGVMTLNEPTAGCYWLVVYSHCHLSVFYRER